MHGPYHRLTGSEDEVRKVMVSGELWGRPTRNYSQSDFPKVKAYAGKLPRGRKGFEFETEVKPDKGHVPGQPLWSGVPKRAGVVVEGDFAKIRVRILRQNVIV